MTFNRVMPDLTLSAANMISNTAHMLSLIGVICILAGLYFDIWSANQKQRFSASAIAGMAEEAQSAALLKARAEHDRDELNAAKDALGTAMQRVNEQNASLSEELERDKAALTAAQQNVAALQGAYDNHVKLVTALAAIPLADKPAVEIQRLLSEANSANSGKHIVDAVKEAGLKPIDHTFQAPYRIKDGVVVSVFGSKGERFVEALAEARLPYRKGNIKPLFGRADVVVTIGSNAPPL